MLVTLATGVIYAGELSANKISLNKWTGFYLGGNIGGAWADPSINIKTVNTFSTTDISTKATVAPSVKASSGIITEHNNGALAGILLGYNYQIATKLITGFEADIQAIDSHHQNSLNQAAPRVGVPSAVTATLTATLTASQQTNYLVTVRGRIGRLLSPSNSWLAYFTGGLAYGGIQSSTSINGGETPKTITTDFSSAGSVSKTQTGYILGAGLEKFVASRWSAKMEYLYYDLGTVTYSNGILNSYGVTKGTLRYTNASSSSVRFNGNIIRLGLSYHFS